MLSEISQSQKDIAYDSFHLHEISKVLILIETEIKITDAGTGKRGKIVIQWLQSFSFTRRKSSRDLLHNV
jgi:hypothetical protein